MRIGKHKGCGGEFVACEVWNDNIYAVRCGKCGLEIALSQPFVPGWKRELIRRFEQAINTKEAV